MKKYKCPRCLSTFSVVRDGYRNKVIRLFCKKCAQSFSINPCFPDRRGILNDHLDGLSFRKLSVKYGISKSRCWELCHEELLKLPSNNQFTFNYCNRFSSTLVVDGKYFNVVNGKDNADWVLIWGIDYFYHDVPIIVVAPSESHHSWSKFFSFFRIINNHPELLVCDDNVNIKMAAYHCFPQVRIQTCFNHFKENIRRNLRTRSDATYIPFMRRIEEILTVKLNDEALNQKLFALYRDFQHDPVAVSVLTNIQKMKPELLGYRGISQSPVTTNIIEGLNGHLEARLQSLRSFQSIQYARLWLNGYVLKRRYTKFTDCKGKFRPLRGKTGLQMTKKPEVILPSYF